MFESFKRFFEQRVAPAVNAAAPAEREHGLRLAAAALLFEVVRADGVVRDEERTVMRTAMQSTFELGREESEELVRLAEDASRQSASLYDFTHVVDQALAPEDKLRLVELLWLLSFADAEKAAEEEHMVRQIAGLLHVEHPDFIAAKIRAREKSGHEKA